MVGNHAVERAQNPWFFGPIVFEGTVPRRIPSRGFLVLFVVRFLD